MSLAGNIRVSASLSNSKEGIDLSTPNESVSENILKTISTGSLYHDTVSLSANQTTELDFGDGSLYDVYGSVVSLSTITGLYVKANSANTSDIVLSGGVNSMLNSQPGLGASEGLGFLVDMDITVNSKLYLCNGAISGSIDIVVVGD